MRIVSLAVVLVLLSASPVFGAGGDGAGDSDSIDNAVVKRLRGEGLERFRRGQVRIQQVAYRLQKSGSALCREIRGPLFGASIARRYELVGYAKKPGLQEVLGVTENVTVIAVAPGTPADRAGLRVGDEILEIDEKDIERSKDVVENLRKSERPDIAMVVKRDGESELTLSLPSVRGCAQGVFPSISASIDTSQSGNGKDVQIPYGLLDFADSDDDLAIAIAHQFGHQIIGSATKSEDEPKADWVGIFLAAAAGYDVSRAPAYWDRVAASEPWKISSDTGSVEIEHGAIAVRSPAIRDAVQRVRSLGQPVETIGLDQLFQWTEGHRSSEFPSRP